jgi:tetratricopeptide (TPR) repeat protein
MSDPHEIDNLRALLATHRRTLAHLLTQQAQFSAGHIPAHVANGIAEARAGIQRAKAALRAAGAEVDDQPDDEDPGNSAARRHTALPLNTIPNLAPLPPGSRMPLARNPLFVGRDDDLKAIAAALHGGGTAAIGQIAAATGLGGIGKTNLATEFVHRHGQFFAGGVFWLSFADPTGVTGEIVACGGPGAMNLPGFNALTLDDQLARVRQEWQCSVPRLLVFDNCEDEALLAEWRPTTGGAHVLLTARRASWDPALGVQCLPLGVLPRAESVALLRKFCPDLPVDDPQIAAIAAELGDLPLALHLAGSFLKKYHADISPAEYLDELRAASLLAHESLQGVDPTLSPTNHILHVGRSFTLSYEKLKATDSTDALALALLARAAYFAPGEPISRDLLLTTVDLPDKPAQRRASRALTRLVDLGLLEVGADATLKLHRLLVTFVRAETADVEAQGVVEQALIDIGYDLLAKRVPAPLSAIQAHLRHVTDAASSRDNARASNLCTVMCRYLGMVGRYAAAQPYAARALAIDEGHAHPHNQTVATHLGDLAELLEAQGDYAAARPLVERALAITEQVLGPEHPDTATGLNNLANLLRYQGEYAVARPLYERALAIREQVLGPEHPDTATNLNNLATLLQYQGDHSAARPLYERALAIREQVLGPEHPDTAVCLNNLANLLQYQGEYAAARPLYERALTICEQVLGPDHPNTATSLNSLANLLQYQGNGAAARPLYERALAIREQVLGPDHPKTAASLNSLANLLHIQRDDVAARPLYERTLAIRERVLGPEHPDTAASMNNMANLLRAQREYTAARPLYERALAIRERVLGPDHPKTATSLTNLADLLHTQREYTAARPLYERALAIRERVLGPEHPDTATTLNNLANLLRSQREYTAARPLYERALAIRERVLGPDHPKTATSLNNLADLLHSQRDDVAARSLYERALAICAACLGADHPTTHTIRSKLAGLDRPHPTRE